MIKILIATSTFAKDDPGILALCKDSCDITLNPYGRKLTGSELIELGKATEGIIAGTENYNEATLKRLPKLRVISRCGVGMDSIDLAAASRLGIRLYNTPDAPTTAVAELTVGLILSLLRETCFMDRRIRSGCWDKRVGCLIKDKHIGVVGFGRIGKKVSALLSPFEAQLAYYDIAPKEGSSCALKPFEELLAWADIITLHCPQEPCAPSLMGGRELRLMKKGSYLLNVSRGGLVDESALFSALKDGHLSGAAIDVFEQEPYQGPLLQLENVILTPHIGSYARESRIEMERQAVLNLLRGINSE